MSNKSSTNEGDLKIGQRLYKVRTSNRLKQKEFSERLNIPLRSYQNYERGERGISKELSCALLETFGTDPSWLLTGKENTHKAVDKELMIEWLTQWLESADEKNQIWLEIQMKRCFPEFEQWEKLKHQKMRD